SVEALASGKPVIALARGGATETVPSFGGVLYDGPGDQALAAAIAPFEQIERDIRPAELQAWGQPFSAPALDRKMGSVLREEPRCLRPRNLSSPSSKVR